MTGTPLMRNLAHSASASASVASGCTVIGSVTMPDSERFTRSTWLTWSSIDRLRCSTPTPPCRAMAIAMRDSVTLSIAADSSGMFTRTLREMRDEVSTAFGQHLGRARQQQHVVVGQPECREFLGHSVDVCSHDTFPKWP